MDPSFLLFDKIIRKPISSYLLDYVTIEFQSILPCIKEDYFTNNNKLSSINNHSSLPSPPLSIDKVIPLRSFIESIVTKSHTDTGTLISSLSYARRLRKRLSRTSKGMECTHHRIFLATLIITTKYLHDTALKNKYWVAYAGMFTANEINLMEKQLLQLLNYDLEIDDFYSIMEDVVQIYAKEYHKSTNAKAISYSPPWDPPLLVSSIL
ncbi:hypothetical protein BCV72DRAFT_123737 [Rhizopus microsporus var. microsporus]|uniref:Cyclin N-terminal domain-containing protein n=2 Tax=Rhizopus microsporus TaxID=58291 RepID=A0A2G4SH40_RHIZD|nr:uncharacterized protein RHIMIDRAFT_302135 [Rhizopus microsporus ATCC 52813]ORE06479.1 hypothetical protein BCV72DRAFT_123737 [Rhizopus microsporus var. microsporus]PHZ08083.1 hypothetical protein RHIMIDRAFT_302135 [Rhizopus microsporus ATCC 52813]